MKKYLLAVSMMISIAANSATVSYVDGGVWHSLFLDSDWKVWSCGCNHWGQLGNGTSGEWDETLVPIQVNDLSSVVAVKAGSSYSLALKNDGTVWAWGNNENCQVNGETTPFIGTPTQIEGLFGIVAIAAGEWHSLALKNDGTVWAWGGNGGALGDGTTTTRSTPVQVIGLSEVTTIAAGQGQSLAVKSDGTLWGWGSGYGLTPVQAVGLSGVTFIEDGVAVRNDGTVWHWDSSGPATMVTGLSGVVAAAGGYQALYLRDDGTVWGSGGVQVMGLSDIVSISGGYYHAIVVKRDGTILAWGDNNDGRLGTGSMDSYCAFPGQVIGISAPTWWHPSAGSSPTGHVINDYDGDGKSDVAVYHESSGYWYILKSTEGFSDMFFGGPGYTPVAGDYDGDKKADLAVYGSSLGDWYMFFSGSLTLGYDELGGSEYTPVPGCDFDGDGKTDQTVYDAQGFWDAALWEGAGSISFGAEGYDPVAGDYDGDGHSDLVVYDESTGYWYFWLSGSKDLFPIKFGGPGYEPVSGDFDGDGKTELAVYEGSSGYWYMLLSTSYALSCMKFGEAGYTPVPGDYDGDGKTDVAVYHEASGYWYIFMSSTYSLGYVQFGGSGYVAVR